LGLSGEVLLFGGRDATRVYDELWVLTSSAHDVQWIQVEKKECMEWPSPRHSHAACCIVGGGIGPGGWESVLVVTGGLGLNEQVLGDAFVLELISKESPLDKHFRWRRLPVSGNICRRFGHNAQLVSDVIVLFGGVAVDSKPGVDLQAPLEWCKLNAFLKTDAEQIVQRVDVATAASNVPFLSHGCVYLLLGTKLFVLGGGGSCFSFGTHVNSCPLEVDLSCVLAAG